MPPASAVVNDVVQGALQGPQHIETNYEIADYELPGVSEMYTRGLSSSCTDTPPTTPVSHSSIYIFQCRTCSRCSRIQKSYPLCVYRLTFPEYIPNWTVSRRRTKEMTVLVMLLRASYQALLRLPLLGHRLITQPCFPSQRQRICEDSRAVACTTLILKLMWFGWNRVVLGDTRW